MSERGSLLDRLRQPEYTGDNRCLPCTVVNLLIAALLAGVVALLSPPAAAVVLVLSAVTVALRGYLVPGTPELTRRYLPASVLRLFGKHPAAGTGPEEPAGVDPDDLEVFERVERRREEGVETADFLQDVGAIERCADGEGFCLTDSFAGRVAAHAERRTVTGDVTPIATVFGVEPGEVTPLDREYPAVEVGVQVRKWPSVAALTADIATDRALAGTTDRWRGVPPGQRREILESLRGFHEHCPLCGGPVTLGEEVLESCCGTHQVTTVACNGCGRRLREFDQTRAGPEHSKGITP
ncbi:MAG: hypothetical protein ACI9CA_001570 [Natronomonas sp.]|jgi:hypothetical protein